MRAPEVLWIAVVWPTSLVAGAAIQKRQGGLDSCTQTDLNELGGCIDSALSVFSVTFQAEYSSSFDYGSIVSEINSLQSGLTSLGVTLTSFLDDPSSFAATAEPGSTYAGPFVSDIISSYSEYTATRTDSSGSVFSFETSNFTPTGKLAHSSPAFCNRGQSGNHSLASPTSIPPTESTSEGVASQPAPAGGVVTSTNPISAGGSTARSSGGISTSTSAAVTAPITSTTVVTPSTRTISSRSTTPAQAAAATSSAAGNLSPKATDVGLVAFAMVSLSVGYQTLVALVAL